MFEIGFAAQKLSEFSIQSRKVAFGHLDPRTHLSADQTVPGHAQLVLQSSFLPGNLPPGNRESGQIGASRGRGGLCFRFHHRGKQREGFGVNRVGFGQLPHHISELSGAVWVHHSHMETRIMQVPVRAPMTAAGCLRHDQLRLI